jgi:hypothetical protein
VWAEGYSAVVTAPEIEVRSGPALQYPPAGKLRRNDPVWVKQLYDESGQWLVIAPPEGSVSWINHRFLGEIDPTRGDRQNAVVAADKAPVRSSLGNDSGQAAVERVTLPRGAIVEVTGPKVVAEGSTWYPIKPAPTEVRYVPANAVARTEPVASTSATSETAPGVLPTTSGPGKPIAVSTGGVNSPGKWQQAEQAERSGNFQQAERLYLELAAELKRDGGDHDLAVRSYNRANQLRELMRGTMPSSVRPDVMPVVSRPGAAPTLGPPTAPERNPNVFQPTSYPRPEPAPSTASQPAAAPPAAGTAMAGANGSGPGWLRKAGFFIDGKQAYVLEANNAQTRVYLTAQPGVTLESYVNRQVELFGPVVYRGDIRGGNYMTVSRVSLIR